MRRWKRAFGLRFGPAEAGGQASRESAATLRASRAIRHEMSRLGPENCFVSQRPGLGRSSDNARCGSDHPSMLGMYALPLVASAVYQTADRQQPRPPLAWIRVAWPDKGTGRRVIGIQPSATVMFERRAL